MTLSILADCAYPHLEIVKFTLVVMVMVMVMVMVILMVMVMVMVMAKTELTLMSMVMIFFNKFNTFWEHFDKRLGLLLRVFSKVPKGSCLCHPHSCVGADGNKNGAVVGVRTTKEWKQVCL